MKIIGMTDVINTRCQGLSNIGKVRIKFFQNVAGSETALSQVFKELGAEDMDLLGRRERRIFHVFVGLSLHALN